MMARRLKRSKDSFRCAHDFPHKGCGGSIQATYARPSKIETRINNERKIMTGNLTKPQTLKSGRATGGRTAVGRLVILDLSGGRVFTVNPDGSDKRVIVTDCHWPDGVAVDVEAGHIYWTNMGVASRNDGSIERADFDGQNRKTIVPEGQTFTPKQLHLDKETGKLYWCDREGMRVMRSNLDGSSVETLVDTSQGEQRPGRDQTKWCFFINSYPVRDKIYWTQEGVEKAGRGRIFLANIEFPIFFNDTATT